MIGSSNNLILEPSTDRPRYDYFELPQRVVDKNFDANGSNAWLMNAQCKGRCCLTTPGLGTSPDSRVKGISKHVAALVNKFLFR